MKQLHLFDSSVVTTGYRDWELDNFESSITDSKPESESNPAVIELAGCLGTYAKKGKDYYRFSYREGTKTHHYHIKGGCIGTPTADAKARQIREAIAASRTRSEILALLE